MPRVRAVFGAAGAFVVMLSTLVLAVPTAYAQAAPGLPEGHAECNTGVFGRVPSAKPVGAPSWTEPSDYVQWRYDMGYSMVASCVVDVGGIAAASYTTGDVVRLTHVGITPPVSQMQKSTYALEGVPGRDANGRVWSTGSGTWTLPCFSRTGTTTETRNLSGGFATNCRSQDGGAASSQRNNQYSVPLLTELLEANGRVRFSFRIDMEPTGTAARCLSGSTADNGAGANNWRCPIVGPPPDPDSTFYMPRDFAVTLGYHLPGTSTSSAVTVKNTAFTAAAMAANPYNTDSGAAVPVPAPNYTAPGWDGAGGTCDITGWVLRNNTDGRQWTDKSADRFSIIMTSGHDHTLTVSFRGRPSTIQVRFRRNASTVWQRQTMSPAPPRYAFTGLTGDGQRGLLYVTCIGADGDIHPDGQDVITDEPENTGTSLEECLGSQEFTLTSPGSWIRYGVNGVGCLLRHLFVPEKPISERFYELRSSSDTATWASGVVAGVSTGLTGLASTGPANCAGPTINAPEAGMNNLQPFSVCSGSTLAPWASIVRAVLTGGVVLAAIMRMVRIAQAAFNGDSVPVYQAEFNTDVSSGGRWR